ncbi:uncharacterized protein [Mytilus edulis]|uniref:uncharacterized protein isoform X4 n=1 Tax=Mytilus edulis TaxID=6550 RepID=UPI0039EE1F18
MEGEESTAKDSARSESEAKIKEDEIRTEKEEERKTPEIERKISPENEQNETPERSGSRQSRKDNDSPASGRKSVESRPKSSESIDRPKSTASNTSIGKTRRGKKGVAQDVTHSVTFKITVSVAVPTGLHVYSSSEDDSWVEDDDVPDLKELMKKKKRTFEVSKPQGYFHTEYSVLPGTSPTVTDLVLYGPLFRLFKYPDAARNERTWQEGDLTWVAWTHHQTIDINKDVLLKLFDHTLEMRVWNIKEKLKPTAKNDRLNKPIKLPSNRSGDIENRGVRAKVSKQFKNFNKLQPKKSTDLRPLPTQVSFTNLEMANKKKEEPVAVAAAKSQDDNASDKKSQKSRQGSPTPKTLMGVPSVAIEDGRNSFSRLGRLAGPDAAPGSPKRDSPKRDSPKSKQGSSGKQSRQSGSPTQRQIKSSASLGSSKGGGFVDKELTQMRPRRPKRMDAATREATEHAKQYGVCMIPIKLSRLFSELEGIGVRTVTNRLESPVPGVEDCFVTIELSDPLMAKEHIKELNPMIFKISSAKNMPDTPLSYSDLSLRCQPVYCKYKFYKQPEHISVGREHGKNLYWDDINVILAGTIEPSELRQYLNGPAFELEIHDRDRKGEECKPKPALFGDDLEDEKISNVGTVASRRTINNPFVGRNKPWDPYGVAKLDLSELLLGHQYIHLKVPIHNCAVPEILGSGDKVEGKIVGMTGAVDGPVDKPLPAGHYIQAHTMLKVKVEVAYPLVSVGYVSAKIEYPLTIECPFSRIVFMFDYKNTSMLTRLQELVVEINATALELDDMPQHVINAALSTYKLSLEQQRSRDLDIVTGFQLMDGDMHLFILEGMRERAVMSLWDSLPRPENTDVRVLYNSDYSFGERLYGPLDVDLCRVKLHEPLSIIVQQPLLYVRDMVPRPCFEALVKLYEITKLTQMKNVVRNGLFPTADMVISMSKEFGVPLTQEDFEELQPVREKTMEETEVRIEEEPNILRQTSRIWTPIDHLNKDYIDKLASPEKEKTKLDFIKENKEMIKFASDINKAENDMNKVPTVKADVKVAHNYSTHHLNSTELAKEKLRQMLAQNPDTRYTYCQDYHHSMTVVPVNVEALKKQAEVESKARWKTEKGLIYPGFRTMQESNIHPKKPGTPRRDSLREQWIENILHVGLLQPPLNRDKFPWQHRSEDLELYRRPATTFGREPVTIHLAGQKLKQEKLESFKQDYETWKSKIIVKDPRGHFHRCLPETEMNEKGQNQIDKLKGLLKEKPEKLSLKRPGFSLRDIPPLNVVLNPSVDSLSRLEGKPLLPAVPGEGNEKNKGFNPGPFEENSWVMEKNKIPVPDYEHQRFRFKKGQDFNAIHKERALLHRKDIIPLTDSERDNHLFRIPDDPKRFGALPELTLGPENPAQESRTSINQSVVDPMNSQTNMMTNSQAQLETAVQ